MDACSLEDLRADDQKCGGDDVAECTGDSETLTECPNVVTGTPMCGGGSAPPESNCCGTCGGDGGSATYLVMNALLLLVIIMFL